MLNVNSHSKEWQTLGASKAPPSGNLWKVPKNDRICWLRSRVDVRWLHNTRPLICSCFNIAYICKYEKSILIYTLQKELPIQIKLWNKVYVHKLQNVKQKSYTVCNAFRVEIEQIIHGTFSKSTFIWQQTANLKYSPSCTDQTYFIKYDDL